MTTAGGAHARTAAFFDVDGTLVKTTIVHYYIYFRRRRMSPLVGAMWNAVYLLKCLYSLALDRVDRGRLNVVFYRDYAGLPAADIRRQVGDCYRDVIQPRQFEQSAGCVADHKNAGRSVVLVTGSIDFLIEPLARALGADAMVAPTLVEFDGRFTGELDGPPLGNEEKARRVRAYADNNDIDLALSHAYGDSIADLPMLEAVGNPHAVNPDKALAAIAKGRDWPICRWTIPYATRDGAR